MGSRQPDRCIPHVQEVFGGRRSPPAPVQPSVVAERELKHIEKRMSMKKTIRKQISRQLAQAFIENPELKREQNGQQLDCNRNDRTTHNLTLTKSKMLAKMDANFLDLLRRAEEVGPNIDSSSRQAVRCVESPTGQSFKTPMENNLKKPSLWKRLWSNSRR